MIVLEPNAEVFIRQKSGSIVIRFKLEPAMGG